MTDRTCILSHFERPTEPRATWGEALICRGHVAYLRRNLGELACFPAAVVTVTHSETMSISIGGTITSGSKEMPTPVNDGRVDHIAHIRQRLGSWCLLIAEERQVTVPVLPRRSSAEEAAYAEVPVLAAFLATHLDWAVEMPWIDDMFGEVRDDAANARGLLYPRKGENRTQLPCPLTDSEGCTGTLTAVNGNTDDETQTVCDVCGYILPADQWRTYRRQLAKKLDPDSDDRVLVTETDALLWATAEGLRLTGPTIRSWANRGQIQRHERNGRTLYDLDELRERLSLRSAA